MSVEVDEGGLEQFALAVDVLNLGRGQKVFRHLCGLLQREVSQGNGLDSFPLHQEQARLGDFGIHQPGVVKAKVIFGHLFLLKRK